MSRAKKEDAEATLARLRAAQLARLRKSRARAAAVISGLTLDAEHVHALRIVQRATRERTRAAAIRAAIRMAAASIERGKHEQTTINRQR